MCRDDIYPEDVQGRLPLYCVILYLGLNSSSVIREIRLIFYEPDGFVNFRCHWLVANRQ
jgi:hypothetical protein